MRRRKSTMQTTEREKTATEKMTLAYCHCEHTNTVHAGGLWTCGFIGCTCQEFKERIKSDPPPGSFQHVKKVMSGEIP